MDVLEQQHRWSTVSRAENGNITYDILRESCMCDTRRVVVVRHSFAVPGELVSWAYDERKGVRHSQI